MSISTRSIFYYGHTIDETNNLLDFDEGSGQLTAEIPVGSYSLEELAQQLASSMSEASTLPQTYEASVNRSERKITISSTSTFSLLIDTGTSATSVYALAGFTGSDRTGSTSYEGDSASGKAYKPQFTLQKYISFDKFQTAASASLNKSASGRTELITFGREEFSEFEIKWTNNIDQGKGGPIETNLTGVEDLIDFLQDITKKNVFEYMPDRDNVDIEGTGFFKCILESTEESKEGTGYRLKELINRGLPGYYDTGNIKIRRLT